MAILDTSRLDLDEIRAFADGIPAIYQQAVGLRRRIVRFMDATAAIEGGTATDRDIIFVNVVQSIVSAADLPRIGALLPTLTGLIDLLETDYSDFLVSGG